MQRYDKVSEYFSEYVENKYYLYLVYIYVLYICILFQMQKIKNITSIKYYGKNFVSNRSENK